jgi:CBS-domain-containing membrane protein
MPGFMGIRGLEHRNPHDMERERREEQQTPSREGQERRSREKVQEILKDQDGDMSAFRGNIADPRATTCSDISKVRVDKIMSGRVAVLSFDDTLLMVQGIFNSVKFRHLPVVDDNGHIMGIISDRDFLRMTSPFFGTINEQKRDQDIMMRKVGMVMTRNPVCTTPEVTILNAVRLMNHKKISCLPVVEGAGSYRLLGIVTWKDVVRAFCPAGFNPTHESTRLKTGVQINAETSESARLKAKTAESVRLRAQKQETAAKETPPAASAGTDRPRPDAKDESETSIILRNAPPVMEEEVDLSRFDQTDLARITRASGRDDETEVKAVQPQHPSDSAIMRTKTTDIDDIAGGEDEETDSH